jgi:hypothetical protein
LNAEHKFTGFTPRCFAAAVGRTRRAQYLPGLFLITASFLAPLRLSTAAGAARPAPVIVCDECECFFGAVPNTEVIRHEFILANEGAAPLHIPAVRTDCGCVAARVDDDTLAPGEHTALRVIFKLKGRSGPQMRRIIVESNDPKAAQLVLALIGEALAPLEIKPGRIAWGIVHEAARVEKSCEIRFAEGDETYITAVAPEDPSFAAEFVSLKPRRVYRITVRTAPPLRPGSFQSTLRALTDHPRFKIIEIPMQGRVVGDIYAVPGEIVIPSRKRGTDAFSLMVYSGQEKKFKLLRAEPPAPEIKTTLRPMAGNRAWRIDIDNIMPSDKLNGTDLVIFTDSDATPVLKVPIRTPDAGERHN